MTAPDLAVTWPRYVPDAERPWNAERVVRLHRRAGFGATPDVLRRDLDRGPEATIAALVSPPASGDDRMAELAESLARAAVGTSNLARLQASWLHRMLFGDDPLGERLVLFWHNWFATSAAKVDNLAWMHGQNATFRAHARGRFAELLRAMLRDPALLAWLDAPLNTKDRPNENLARELLELFTIGVGHYDERDVKETARALTGWASRKDRRAPSPEAHDDGEKTILGRTGRFSAPDVAEMLLAHPALPRRLGDRLITEFLGERKIPEASRAALARHLADSGLDLRSAVETIVASEWMLSDLSERSVLVAPVPYLVSIPRALGLGREDLSSLDLAPWLRRVGQDLFRPPTVEGWHLGRDVLATQLVAGRLAYAAAVVEGSLTKKRAPLDLDRVLGGQGGLDADRALELLARRFRGTSPTAAESRWIRDSAGGGASTDPALLRRSAALLLASPWSQSC